MTNYVLNHTDGSLQSIVIAQNTTITPTHPASQTSLTLFGKGAANYGQGQQQNFLQMLENFALDTPPIHPQVGQMWFNTADKRLKVYDGLTWKPVTGMIIDSGLPAEPVAHDFADFWWDTTHHKLKAWDGTKWAVVYPVPIRVAYIDEYNDIAHNLNIIIGDPQGTTAATAIGYGQAPIPTWPTTVEMGNSDWIEILNRLRRVAEIQGQPGDVVGDISPFGFIHDSTSEISFGLITSIQNFTTTYNTLLILQNNVSKFGYNGNPNLFNTVSVPLASPVRTASWQSTKTFTVNFDFASAKAAKSFFNAGGLLNFTASLDTTGQPAGSPGEVWTTLLAKMGKISLGAYGTFQNDVLLLNSGGSAGNISGGWGVGAFGGTAGSNGNLPFGQSNIIANTVSLNFYNLGSTFTTFYTDTLLDGSGTVTIEISLVNGGTRVVVSIVLAALASTPGPIAGRTAISSTFTKLIDSVDSPNLWTFTSGIPWNFVISAPLITIDPASTFLDNVL